MFGNDLKRLDDELKQLNATATKLANEYAKVVYPIRIYMDVTRYYLAAKICELRDLNPKSKFSEAKLENLARADKLYAKTLSKVVLDTKASEGARIRYESAVREVESCRTRISLHKSEIDRFGG